MMYHDFVRAVEVEHTKDTMHARMKGVGRFHSAHFIFVQDATTSIRKVQDFGSFTKSNFPSHPWNVIAILEMMLLPPPLKRMECALSD